MKPNRPLLAAFIIAVLFAIAAGVPRISRADVVQDTIVPTPQFIDLLWWARR